MSATSVQESKLRQTLTSWQTILARLSARRTSESFASVLPQQGAKLPGSVLHLRQSEVTTLLCRWLMFVYLHNREAEW